MMGLFRNTIVGAAIGAGAFAFSVISASAYISATTQASAGILTIPTIIRQKRM